MLHCGRLSLPDSSCLPSPPARWYALGPGDSLQHKTKLTCLPGLVLISMAADTLQEATTTMA